MVNRLNETLEVGMARFSPVAIFALCLLFFPCASPAGPFRMMGYDSGAVGQGGNQGAWATGVGSLFSNPALLVDLEEQTSFSFFFVQPLLSARLMQRPQNADVPITIYDSDVGLAERNLDRPLPTVELPHRRADNTANDPQSYLGIGINHSFGIPDFRFGFQLLLPVDGLASVRSLYADEREQFFSNTVHFTRFGEWDRMLLVLAGVAYRPFSWLSAGVAAEGSLSTGANLNIYVPEATVQDYAMVNATIDAKPVFRAIIGVAARMEDWGSASLVWRDRRFSQVDSTSGLGLWNFHEPGNETIPKRVVQHHLLVLDFEPMEVALSAGVRFRNVSLQAAVTWNRWSDYLDTHHQRPEDAAIFDSNQQTDTDVIEKQFSFQNTFSGSLGATWAYRPGLSLSAGIGYHPTPVPAQVGRTNYLDSDLVDLGIGHRFEFTVGGHTLIGEIGIQLWRMVETTVYKDPAFVRDEFPDDAKTLIGQDPMPEAAGLQTNNPGFPGFTFGGFAILTAVSLSYLY
jgi:long-chain fatty acid transport protein